MLPQGFDVYQAGRVVGKPSGERVHHAVQHRHVFFGLHDAAAVPAGGGEGPQLEPPSINSEGNRKAGRKDMAAGGDRRETGSHGQARFPAENRAPSVTERIPRQSSDLLNC
ncbi:hypothetical protein GCM10009850_035450 [Nonomuraea monospora]|uniref:Uncharacterized protein n=1 Tax=Nonomuraea monospora TaxID=568818 RepID=A0ABN3CFC2_9ACTN